VSPEATKDKILKVAMEVIAEKGYDSASLREIAERAGVSKPLVIWYFGGKKGLVRKVAEKALPRDVAENCLELGYKGEELLKCIVERFMIKYSDNKMRKLLVHTLSLSIEDESIGKELHSLCRETLSKIAEKSYDKSTPVTRSLVRFLFGALLCHALNPVNKDELKTYIRVLRLLTSPKTRSIISRSEELVTRDCN